MTACQPYGRDITETTSAIYGDDYYELFKIESISIVEFPHVKPPKNKAPSFPRSRKERRNLRKLR